MNVLKECDWGKAEAAAASHRVPWPKDRPELSLDKNMEFLSGPAAGEGKHESLVCVIQVSITHWWEQAPSVTSPGLLSHGTEQWKN